jgi:hypothetical protein
LAVYGDLTWEGFVGGWSAQDRWEVKAVDDCGLAAAAVVDGRIEDRLVMCGWCLKALG